MYDAPGRTAASRAGSPSVCPGKLLDVPLLASPGDHVVDRPEPGDLEFGIQRRHRIPGDIEVDQRGAQLGVLVGQYAHQTFQRADRRLAGLVVHREATSGDQPQPR